MAEMLKQEEDEEQQQNQPSSADAGGVVHRKTYLRSVSLIDRSPRTPSPRPQPSTKPRLCLPPLQPLSVSRRSLEEWPSAGSDDLGVWPQAPTPRAKGSVKKLPNSNSEQPEREFQFMKDKLAFFDKECSRIVDHVYLGSDSVAKNREILIKNGITHVLNCVGFVCPEYFKPILHYKTLWLHDSPCEDITSILFDVFDYFEDVREQGGRVLVHCCKGVSRSTSLVIAYLMWRERQSFTDALQYVKKVRGVTNPNMGFTCQLLECQERTLAFLERPNSVLRMYRMAPHSSYDPLHLVPKMLGSPGAKDLDSRGAFVVHVPRAVYVWIGKHCVSVMLDSARVAAFQVIRYEMAQGPVVIVKEGEEPVEFWDALVRGQMFLDGCGEEEETIEGESKLSIDTCIGERKVDLYDMDFELFHKALVGGVVPPFLLSGSGSETSLPARESGWGRLRRKFARGIMKEFISSSKLCFGGNTQSSLESDLNSPLPSTSKSGSPEYSFCSPISSPSRINDACKEGESSVPLTDPLLSPCMSLDSFSSCLVNSSKFCSKSPSFSPATSDSSFTFSPTSSNWSDLSYLSSQASPSGLDSSNPYHANTASLAENACLICKATYPSLTKPFSANHRTKDTNTCLSCKGTTPSIAERRGSNPPPCMMLPSVDESSQVLRHLERSRSFSLPNLQDAVMMDVECNEYKQLVFYDLHRKQSILDTDMLDVDNELDNKNRRECVEFQFPPNDTTSRVAEAEATTTSLVLYQWPTMDRVEMHQFATLDSKSVYITFVSDVSLDENNHDVLYIWLGHEVSCGKGQNQLICSDSMGKNSHVQWETVGCNFLKQMGLPVNSSVQIVREGEEPEQLLKHLNSFSFYRAKDIGD